MKVIHWVHVQCFAAWKTSPSSSASAEFYPARVTLTQVSQSAAEVQSILNSVCLFSVAVEDLHSLSTGEPSSWFHSQPHPDTSALQ